MKRKLIIEQCRVDEPERVLHLTVRGEIEHRTDSRQKTLRLEAVFHGRGTERYFPLSAECRRESANRLSFFAVASIQLEEIFFASQPEEDETIYLDFLFCGEDKRWYWFDAVTALDARWFVKRAEKLSLWKRGWCMAGYLLCTVLLPVWLLDGFLALKGYRKLQPAAEGMQGKKALLYHAHGIVTGLTGHGYSIREMKTRYFKKQYEKYCRKFQETEGILFLSERRVEKGGNLELVREQIAAQGKYPIHEFLETRPVHKLSRKELQQSARLIAKAGVVVLEDFYPQLHALHIRPQTRIIQLWHACGAFKLFGLSELGKLPRLPQSTRNHRNYDAAVTSSEGIAPLYSEAFGIPLHHICPVGVPRTDIFFREAYRQAIRTELYRKYPVCLNKRVVLFAPTFRGSGNKTAYYPVSRFSAEQLLAGLPEDVILIIKNHPFVHQAFPVGRQYENRILDLSEGENINDLLFLTSLLITDYSSSVFEAALLDIPMLFYVFDLDDYLAERDFYFDFASFVPGEMAVTMDELVQKASFALQEAGGREEKIPAGGIVETNAQQIQAVGGKKSRQTVFREFFLGALDGHSTERTVQLIYRLLEDTRSSSSGRRAETAVAGAASPGEKSIWSAECRSLWKEVFADSEAWMDYYWKYKWPGNQVFVLYSAQMLCAAMHLNPYLLQLAGRQVYRPYLVGVATRPEQRRKGYMGRLLQKTFAWLYQKRMPWLYLMPAAEAIYRPYQFLPVYRAEAFWDCFTVEKCRPEGEDGHDSAIQVIPFDDLTADGRKKLAEFAAVILGNHFTVFAVHGLSYFQEMADEMKTEEGDLLILREGEEILGYVEYFYGAEGNPDIECVETVIRRESEESGYSALQQYLLKRYRRETLRVRFTESSFLENMRVRAAANGQKQEGARCLTMARVIHLAAAVEEMERPAGWKPVTYCRITDNYLEENTGLWKIDFSEGRGMACKLPEQEEGEAGHPDRRTPEREMDIAEFTGLYFQNHKVYLNEIV